MFRAQPILIVEDEPLIGLALADVVADMGGDTIGPFATVSEALEALDCVAIAGAILDAKLADGDVTPVALRLADAAVPMVVHSGTGVPTELAQRWPGIVALAKPAPASAVVELLHVTMTQASAARD